MSSESISVLPKQHPAFRIDAAISPYAGCSLACAYCPFGDPDKTGIKTDLPHLLAETLRKENRRLHVGLGTSCEPYGPAEEKYGLTRGVIETLLERRLPLQIFTKSPSIKRDMALLEEYSKNGLLAVSVSLFTLERDLSKLFEPNAAAPARRLSLLKEFRKRGVFAGIVLSPIIPYVSDDPARLEEIFVQAKKAGAEYIIPQVLSMESAKMREGVSHIVEERFPKILHRLEYLYETKKQPSLTYAMRVHDLLKELSGSYGIPLYLPIEGGNEVSAGVCHPIVS